MQLDLEKTYMIGADVGGTKILIGIVDDTGRVHYREKLPTHAVPEEIGRCILGAIERAGLTIRQIRAVGLGVPGMVDIDRGIVLEAPALQWEQLPIVERLRKVVPCPIYVDNDVNCAAIGERSFGGAAGMNDFVFIALGTGVGGAVFANGGIVRGHRFKAGELGYYADSSDAGGSETIGPNSFGWLERRASGSYLSSFGIEPEALWRQYAQEEEQAVRIIRPFLHHLAAAVANSISLLNPEAVFIGGGVSRSMENVIGEVRDLVRRVTPIETDIRLSALVEDAGMLGAAALAIAEEHRRRGEV